MADVDFPIAEIEEVVVAAISEVLSSGVDGSGRYNSTCSVHTQFEAINQSIAI